MTQPSETIYCEKCGVEITIAPYIHNGHVYCCQDCFQGLPCRCGERMEEEAERRSPGVDLPA